MEKNKKYFKSIIFNKYLLFLKYKTPIFFYITNCILTPFETTIFLYFNFIKYYNNEAC